MSLDPTVNFGRVTVSQGYDDAATSIALVSGDGAVLPDPSTDGEFNLVWWDSTNFPNPTDDPNVEIVRVTAKSTDTLTVTRAQEGTSASTKNTAGATYQMILSFTKKSYDQLLDSPASSTDNAIVRFDGTGGDTVQDSGVIINDSDEVGINETSPLAQLHITNDQAALTEVRLDNSDASGSMAYTLYDGSNERGQIHYDITSALLNIGTNIATGQVAISSGSDVEALRIDENGIVKLVANDLDLNGNNIINSEFSKSITIESPSASEDISMFFTNKAITITEMRAVLTGSSTPSVTWTVRHASDRSAAGAEVVTSGTTTTSTTSGDDVTTFNDADIPADSHVWVETTAQSGTVDSLAITIFYTID